MFELFQRYFNFRAVVYTNSPLVTDLCNRLGIYSEGDYAYPLLPDLMYSVNPYNMPLIRYMYNRTMQMVSSDYYGYINSDIVMTPNIFEALDATEKLVQEGKIKPKVNLKIVFKNSMKLRRLCGICSDWAPSTQPPSKPTSTF